MLKRYVHGWRFFIMYGLGMGRKLSLLFLCVSLEVEEIRMSPTTCKSNEGRGGGLCRFDESRNTIELARHARKINIS